MQSTYDQCLSRLLAHEGGYTNHPSDPGGPTNFGITIHDYRKYVKPDATAADVRAMKLDEAKTIYRHKYWDAQRCDELPAGVDYVVFDYGVNSGIGRSGKVLRRALKLADNSSSVTDAVIAAARATDARRLIAAICDERLRFLQSLRTWPVFGAGWGRRVAEVRSVALAMAANAPAPAVPQAAAPGQATVPAVAKAIRHGSTGAIAAVGATAAQQAHQSGMPPAALALIVAATVAIATAAWLFWHWHRRRKQEAPVAMTGADRELMQHSIGEVQSMRDKIKTWFKNSVTILWARIVALAGLLLAAGESLLNDPNVTGAIQAALQPKYIPYYVIAIGLVTELARRRTAGKVE
jgi:lysozyme family protein